MTTYEFAILLWLVLTVRAHQCVTLEVTKEKLFVWKCGAMVLFLTIRWMVS